MVLVFVRLAQVDKVRVEHAHVLVLLALDACFNLVRVGHGLIHPLFLEAVLLGVHHRCIAHVLERRSKNGIDLVGLLEADIAG